MIVFNEAHLKPRLGLLLRLLPPFPAPTAFWTTTLLSRALLSRLGGEEWRPSPKSAVYIIATRAWRRPARCMAEPGVRPGTGSVCAGQEKTPPILPFTTQMESDQRLRVCRRDAPGPTNAFAAESDRPTTFSVRTTIAMDAFRRLTARLPVPKLCLQPRPHRVRHELRPPALANPDSHPGSGRPPTSAVASSLHPRGVGRQGVHGKA